ncbi:peptidoglycan-binding LysM [Paucimonas lemoignei]|nr:peptidoglycan-binding LysM [Paucimonas lemoignei]
MNTQTYTVQQDDTLSTLAQRFGSSVGQLQELNPFIHNPNYIRAGWTLNIPTPESAVSATASEPPVSEVLKLERIPDVAEHDTTNFCGAQACSESSHYYDILYEVGQDSFWLMREHTADVLVKAADKLKKAVVTTDADSRIKALNERGLMEFFLEPKLSSFLDTQKSQKYHEIEQRLRELKQEIKAFEAEGAVKNGLKIDNTPLLTAEQNREIIPRQKQFRELAPELRALETEARQQARKEGYRFLGGELFSPEAIEMGKILELYIKQRQDLIDGKNPDFKQEEIDQFRKVHAKLQGDLAAGVYSTNINLVEWVRESETLFRYSEFTKTLMRAAAYGIALPEFALHHPDEDISWGIKRYREYHELLKKKAALEKGIETDFDNWLRVGRQQPPSSLFESERLQWQQLENTEKALKQDAEDIIRARKPALHLLWEPETFTPKPEQRLVRSNFPLREISVPTERERLSHLSFKDLRNSLGRQAQKTLQEDLAKIAAKTGNPNFNINAGNLSDGDALDYWFIHMDAKRLKVQEGWFDTSGFFAPERFRAYLKAQGFYIENLRDDAEFEAWGNGLKQMLFKKSPLGPLRLIDNSPQARLIRCLTPPQSNLHSGATAKGFQLSLNKGASTGVETFLDINLARGEVELVQFELPKRNQATSVKAKYLNFRQQEAEVDLGRFCLEGGIKAWGFAGASMLLSANLALKPSDSKNDVELDTRRDAQRGITRVDVHGLPNARADEVINANLNLFAGVQAGIKISGSLQWAPPKDLLTARSVQPYNELDPSKKDWLTVASLGVNFSAAAGVGAKGDFSLSLQNGQIILRLKAALIAGVGADGEFNFVLGYKAMVHFLDIFNRELIRNEYHKLDWIMPEAFEYFTKAQVLVAAGMELQWLFLLGYNKVNALYEAMTAADRAGGMAYTIVKNKQDRELMKWVAMLTPEGLGSLLGTFLQLPKSFELTLGASAPAEKYSAAQSRSFQRQAIEIILGAIVANAYDETFYKYGCIDTLALARRGFREAVERIEGHVAKASYTENVYKLDDFMLDGALSDSEFPRLASLMEEYKKHRAVLSPDVMWRAETPTFETIMNLID